MKTGKNLLGLIIVLGVITVAGKYSVSSEITLVTEPPSESIDVDEPPMATRKPTASTISLDIETREDIIRSKAMGNVYFQLYDYNEATHKSDRKFVRLPGLCVVGIINCPAPEEIETPFNLDNFDGLDWSPDGKRAAVIETSHVEFEWGTQRQPPSRIYLFDVEKESWTKIFESTEYVVNGVRWSPDGKLIALSLYSVPADEERTKYEQLYVINPDGTTMKLLVDQFRGFYGWGGERLLFQTMEDPDNENFIIYSIDPENEEITQLFAMDRLAVMQPSPDGTMLAFADQQSQQNPTPLKEIRLTDPAGKLIQILGSYSNKYTGINPVSWSRDSSLIAFHNFGTMYLAEPGAEPEVLYRADDSHSQPSIGFAVFSPDSQYLLMNVNDGQPKFISVAIDGKNKHVVTWEGKEDLDIPSWPSWSIFEMP